MTGFLDGLCWQQENYAIILQKDTILRIVLINSRTFEKNIWTINFWRRVIFIFLNVSQRNSFENIREFSKFKINKFFENLFRFKVFWTHILIWTKMFSQEFQKRIAKFWPPKVRKSLGSILWRELNISQTFVRCVGVGYTSSVCSQRDNREQVVEVPLETISVFFL
jgi:hypothetical protein